MMQASTNKLLLAALAAAFLTLSQARAQETSVPKPPPMKPEMTEFWEPQVRVVAPGATPQQAPADAIILFDGKDLSKWKGRDGDAKWQVGDGAMTVVKGTGQISTRQEFEDFQLHIEWRAPAQVVGSSQGRGNSGIFLQGKYELQVLDSYNNRTYANGQAASIYKQTPPLANAMRKPGEWNTYDILYSAPRFKENGTLLSPARVTVLHNGVVVQYNTTIQGATEYIGLPSYKAHGKGPIVLQDHGNPVSFRNIWIREL
jgi:hypothetical protein